LNFLRFSGIALSHAASDSPDDFQTVVTVPAVFTSAHRDVVASCADRAGFNVIQVISEPAAACLAYGLGQLDPSERFYAIVFRIGGVGMDVSLVLVNAGFVSVVETVTKDVGGHQVTELIVDYLAAEFQR
jgi:molecular chaperone DnaK